MTTKAEQAQADEELELAAAKRLARWRRDPVAFVREEFGAEPDRWQAKVLKHCARKKGEKRVRRKIALVACKGPGKSTVKAWITWWILVCYTDAQGIACSITSDNLKDGLWKELALWHAKSAVLQAAFSINSERIASKEERHEKTWFCSARSFPKQADKEQQANTLAGLHAKVVFAILDEVGDYPDGVVAAADGIFANTDIDVWLIMGGNPTRSSGPLYNAATRDAAYWYVVNISGDPKDPDRSPRIDVGWAQAQIDKWGRDNPWVMCNVLGQFPPSAADQVIAVNLVTAAIARVATKTTHHTDPIVWGLDPARFGDDEISLCKRQGVVAYPFVTWRGLDGVQLATKIAHQINKAEDDNEKPDAIFVDVGGVGSSCYDHLCFLGFEDIVHPIDFGSAADDREVYANKRTEIWFQTAEWLKRKPACLPNDGVLQGELTAPTFKFRVVQKRTVYILESKEDMKARGVPSPNRADSLALTFSAPVARIGAKERNRRQGQSKAATEYDPYEA